MKGREEEDKPPFRQLFAEEGGRKGVRQEGLDLKTSGITIHVIPRDLFLLLREFFLT